MGAHRIVSAIVMASVIVARPAAMVASDAQNPEISHAAVGLGNRAIFPEAVPSPEPPAWRENPLQPARPSALPLSVGATSQPVSGGLLGADPLIFDRDWLLGLGSPTALDDELLCLREAIYHEARGEDVVGQYAVAEVILNRVDSPRFPDTICGVVNQNAHRRNACQFSYACDDRPRTLRDRQAIAIAGQIARIARQLHERSLTDGATHYHAITVQPGWAAVLERTARIGAHVFFREDGRW